jgi:hypothetical protein
MNDRLRFREGAACQVVRAPRRVWDVLDPKGFFKVEHWRKGQLIGLHECPNMITNEGKNRLLNTMFYLATTAARYETWYLGLVDNADPTPSPAAGDTYAQINGTNVWDEWASYDESTRPQWTCGAAASQVITNASPVVFTISASGAVYGLFAVAGPNAATKNDNTAGTPPNQNVLWCVTGFQSGAVTVADDDQLKVTYQISV